MTGAPGTLDPRPMTARPHSSRWKPAAATAIAAAALLVASGCGGSEGKTSPTLTAGQQASLGTQVAALASNVGSVATDAGKCAKSADVARKGVGAVNDCANQALSKLSGEIAAFRDRVGDLAAKTTGPCSDALKTLKADLSKAATETGDIKDEVGGGEMSPFVATASRLAPVLAKMQGDLASALSACRP